MDVCVGAEQHQCVDMADEDTTSSDESDGETARLSAFQRAVRKDAYRRAKDFEDQLERYEGTEGRLDDIVHQMKLWVKNTATEHDPDREAYVWLPLSFCF